MANGTMKQRSKNSWTLWVPAGKDPASGKHRQRTKTISRQRLGTGKWESDSQLKKRAEQDLRRLLVQREDGIDIAPEKLTVSDWLDQWLEGKRANVAERTHRSYETLLKHHVRPVLGTKLLRNLKPADIRSVYTRMAEAGKSGTTMLHCHRVLRQALQQAVRDELANRNIADLIIAPRSDTKEAPLVSQETLNRIISVSDEQPTYGTLVRLTLWTGMRLGEVLGLRWQDVDLDGRRLHVRQTFGNDGKFRQPKTERSRRTISLDPEIVGRLREHRKLQAEHYLETGLRSEHELVFADAAGDPIPQHRVNYIWRSLCKKAGVSGVRFHDLRHAAATMALANGIDVAVVSRRLGHSTPSTTLNNYRHVMPSEDEAAASVMSVVMGAK